MLLRVALCFQCSNKPWSKTFVRCNSLGPISLFIHILSFLLLLTADSALAQTFQSALNSHVGSTPQAVASGDFNGDGKMDLATADSSGNSVTILLGNGDGTFQAPTTYSVGNGPTALIAADFNGDGKLDLAVVNDNANTVSILLGNGDGTFQSAQDYAVGSGPRSIVAADFNGDGQVDLAISNISSNTVSILLGNGNGTFQPAMNVAAGTTPIGIASGDLNGDGKADLVLSNFSSSQVNILLGNGDGTFQTPVAYATGSAPRSVTVADFNGDGILDLATSNQNGNNISVLMGNGDGTFQAAANYVTDQTPVSITAVKLRGSGQFDLAVVNTNSNELSIFRGNGDGTFATAVNYAVGFSPFQVIFADVNGDGSPDVVCANANSNDVSILLGNGDGTLRASRSFATTGRGQIAFGDFNGDGKLDVTISGDVHLGNGDGTFQPGSGGGSLDAVATADLRGAGKLDQVIAHYNGNTIGVKLGNGDGTFQSEVTYPTEHGPQWVAVGDFTGDGKPDLVVANVYTNNVSIFLGNGDGTFQARTNFATDTTPTFVATGDFNGDGKLDLAVVNANSNDISILLGNGDGTFQPAVNYSAGQGLFTLAIGDFNKDGKLDLAVANGQSRNVSILLGNGDGTFQAAANYALAEQPYGIAVLDFDADGNLDLAVTNRGNHQYISVLKGNGDGTFQPPINFDAGQNPLGLVVADFNGDGAPDIIAANSNSNNFTVILNARGTYITLASSQNPASESQSIALTAAVAGSLAGSGVPSGSVTFLDGTTPLGTSPLISGQATVPVSGLAVGAHSIAAAYSGDSAFNAHTSAPFAQVITPPSPVISLSPASLTFSGQILGTTSIAQVITVSNTGITDANVSSIVSTGAFVQNNTCGTTVAAGTNCSISVTFTPSALGILTGALTITDNALGTPQIVTLSGTGISLVSISLSPANSSIPLSGTQQFAVTGTYSDGSTGDLTSVVTWASIAPAVATINNAGLASAAGSGQTTVQATLGAITSSTILTVKPGFVLTGGLSAGRYSHAATLLNNGFVLISGGSATNNINDYLATAELYNPANGTFTSTGSMNTVRASHTATLLNNGMVLIVGGISSANNTSEYPAAAELYDPAKGTFSTVGSLNAARVYHTATLLNNGMVLITGGYNSAGPVASAELYNPATGAFSLTGNLNTPRYFQTATPLNNGMVLIAGGQGSSSAFLATAELYDPTEGTFTLTGSLNTGRYFQTATLLNNGLVLIAGGVGGLGLANPAELYDPVAGTFTLTGNLNIFRQSHTATLLNDGMVLLAGGYSTLFRTGSSGSAELYDPLTGTFTLTGFMSTGHGDASATLLKSGTVLIAGGVYGCCVQGTTTAELYEPGTLTPPSLVSVSLSPGGPMVPLGAVQRFTATGTFSDGSTQTLTSVTWDSSNSIVANITSDTTNHGAAFGRTQGATTITACTGAICGSTLLTVGPPALLAITVTPSNASIPLGLTQKYTAIGAYTDGTTQDVTGSVLWTITTPGILGIDSNGMLTGAFQGSTTLAAMLGSITGTTTVTITPPAVVSVAITPAIVTLPAGLSQHLMATATYSDGSTQDVTSIITFVGSSNPSVADGFPTVVARMPGTATVTVLWSSNISASAVITVLPPALVSISIAPLNSTILPGATQQFTATGLFTDGSQQNLTSSAVWASSPANVASVSNVPGSQGFVSGTSTGIANITATTGAITASTTLTVNFATTGSLNAPRSLHTATLLNNGKVLIVGGDGNGFQASAEIYDPPTGTFTHTSLLNPNRYYHTATLLNNGMVLIVGGVGTNGFLASAELYDPTTGIFTPTGSLNTARYQHRAALLNNGKVLITGGLSGSGQLASAELYDPATGVFTPTGGLIAPRYSHTATLLNNGKVLIVGGFGNGFFASAELYDPATGIFSTTGTPNFGRVYHTATLLNNGKVLIAAGFGGSGDLANGELYDSATGTFTPTGNLNTPRYGHAATLLSNGLVLISGGADNQNVGLASAELYDPASGNFTSTGSLNSGRYYHSATILDNGIVLIAGGVGPSASTNSAELYLPPTTTAPNLVSVSVTPTTPTVLSGSSQTFVATGTFSDSSTQTLQSAIWSSSNQNVATISNDATNHGTAITLSSGSTTISACEGSVCGSTILTTGAPVASLSTGSLTFANQNVGTSSAIQTATLTNTGNVTMIITSLGIIGTNPGDFTQANNCPVSPATLAAGANCTINVTFKPAATGPRSAGISITDDAAGSPHGVSLSGTGALPSITLVPAALAFGNQVTNTTSGAKTITLSNPGSGTLTISSVAITGANLSEFTQTNSCGSSVGPSGTCTISVTFTPATAAAKTASVTVTDNSAGSPHIVSLTGTGILPFTATPSPLGFGNQGVNSTSAAKTVTLTNNTSAAVSISSSAMSGTNAADFTKSATTCGASLASKATCTIGITFTPSTAAAETAALTVTDSAANSPQTVFLTGTGVGQATVSVATLAFGNQGITNTSAAKAVTLTNNTSAAITLSGNSISGTNASAFAVSATTCGASLAGHASCTTSVTFTPPTTGAMTATLSLADTASNSPQMVSLTGTGVQPVTLSAPTLAFGNQGIGSTSAAKTVTITNNNSVALSFSSIAIAPSSGDFGQSATTCGASIGAHGSCTVSVTYTPSVLAAEAATLTFTDTAGNSPQTVSLTGTGVAQFTLSATSIAFGNQAFGTTSTAKSVTITNNTSAAVAISSITIGGTNPTNFTKSATTCGGSVNGHTSCTISFTFSPSAAAPYSATVAIADGASNSPQSVGLSGTGLVPVSVTPVSLTYASQTVGTTSAAQVVTVKNNLPTTLTVSNITITNPTEFLQSATTCGASLNSGASCTISIKFKPSAIGARSGTLTVNDSAATSPQTVSLAGTGK